MRTLAIGDIHGCSHALDLLLKAIALQPGDVLVTLGDYVDRGPDSRGVLERLIELDAQKYLVALCGNHELMMLDARNDPDLEHTWLRVGGSETLESYPGGTLDSVPREHWEFIEHRCVDFWEIPTHFFVHANAYPDMALHEQPTYMLFWEHLGLTAPHISGKVMVCGHTRQKSARPLNVGHAICLDTGAYKSGWLTALDVGSGLVRQANQDGRQRQFMIDDV